MIKVKCELKSSDEIYQGDIESLEDYEKVPRVWKCKELKASGDHLKKFREFFTSIPMADTDSVTWNGEFANFIYKNLEKILT